jgi:hypothetical protein
VFDMWLRMSQQILKLISKIILNELKKRSWLKLIIISFFLAK